MPKINKIAGKPEIENKCAMCAFFSHVPKPETGKTCSEMGIEAGNPLVCASFYPSNPASEVEYASQLLSILLDNARLNKGAVDATKIMEKLNRDSPDLQGEFKPDEFLKLCEKVSGLSSIQTLCDLLKIPHEVKIQILKSHVARMFGGSNG